MPVHDIMPRRFSDLWFLHYPEDKRNEVDRHPVECRDETDLESAVYYARACLRALLKETEHLQDAGDLIEDSEHEGGESYFLDPGRSLPCGEKHQYEYDSKDRHSQRSALNEPCDRS